MSARLFVLARSAAAAAFGAAVVVASAATAVATPTDDAFFADMAEHGVVITSPEDAVAGANTVCREIGSGTPAGVIVEETLANTDLSSEQAAYYVVSAVHHYCPQYEDLLG